VNISEDENRDLLFPQHLAMRKRRYGLNKRPYWRRGGERKRVLGSLFSHRNQLVLISNLVQRTFHERFPSMFCVMGDVDSEIETKTFGEEACTSIHHLADAAIDETESRKLSILLFS
jgi:hypothetical protein